MGLSSLSLCVSQGHGSGQLDRACSPIGRELNNWPCPRGGEIKDIAFKLELIMAIALRDRMLHAASLVQVKNKDNNLTLTFDGLESPWMTLTLENLDLEWPCMALNDLAWLGMTLNGFGWPWLALDDLDVDDLDLGWPWLWMTLTLDHLEFGWPWPWMTLTLDQSGWPCPWMTLDDLILDDLDL